MKETNVAHHSKGLCDVVAWLPISDVTGSTSESRIDSMERSFICARKEIRFEKVLEAVNPLRFKRTQNT